VPAEYWCALVVDHSPSLSAHGPRTRRRSACCSTPRSDRVDHLGCGFPATAATSRMPDRGCCRYRHGTRGR
jgi:hypothetical protein